MSNAIGGYILIPSQLRPSPSEILLSFGQGLSDPRQQMRDPATGRMKMQTVPLATLAGQLTHTQSVTAEFTIGAARALVTVEALPAAGYTAIWLAVDDVFFSPAEWNEGSPLARTTPPSDISAFAREWAAICERVQADYGYFTGYATMTYEEFRDETVLPALRREDVAYLINSAESSHWLSYLGLRLARLWPEPHILPPETTLTSMPSGALFFQSAASTLDPEWHRRHSSRAV